MFVSMLVSIDGWKRLCLFILDWCVDFSLVLMRIADNVSLYIDLEASLD